LINFIQVQVDLKCAYIVVIRNVFCHYKLPIYGLSSVEIGGTTTNNVLSLHSMKINLLDL